MAITKIGTTGILSDLDVPGYLYLSGDNKELRFYNGANYMILKASGSLSNNYTITLPVDDGTSGQFLKTDGGGVTSWDTVTSSDTTYTTAWVDSSANAILRLTAGGSGSGTDDLTIVAGTNITLTPSGDNLTIDAATSTFIGIRVENSSNQSINNNSSTNITFDANATQFDTDTMHVSGNADRITFTTAGKYYVAITYAWDGHGTGRRNVVCNKNGSVPIARQTVSPATADEQHNGYSLIYNFSAGDYVVFTAHQTSGGSLNIMADNENATVAMAYKID